MGQAAGGDVVRMRPARSRCRPRFRTGSPRGIYVNRQGLRFINEDTYYGHIGIESLYRQERRVFLLLDDATYERGLLGLEARLGGRDVRGARGRGGPAARSVVATLALYNRHAARGDGSRSSTSAPSGSFPS